MGPSTLFDRIRDGVSYIAFKVFLWSISSTDEEYWLQVYEIEKAHRESASPNSHAEQ